MIRFFTESLLTCLDSTRALSDPKWSWREDLQQVVKSRVMLLVTDDTCGAVDGSVQKKKMPES